MTDIINDAVQPTMAIDGDEWLVSDVTVELSLDSSPNYVDIAKTVPAEDTDISDRSVESMIGKEFLLAVDTNLISLRDTNAEEDKLLFKGKIANFSALGNGAFEGIAYDPAQEAFERGEEGEPTAGSLLNETIHLPRPKVAYEDIFSVPSGVEYTPRTMKASELANEVINKMGIQKYDIQISDSGVTRSGPGGSVTGAVDTQFAFNDSKIQVKDALDRITKATDSTFWFDKRGVFHIGVPDPTKHSLRYITDTTDGMTTPAYQSVRVIGSGIVTEEDDWNRNHMRLEQRITEEYVIAKAPDRDSFPIVDFQVAKSRGIIDELPKPIFRYRNDEILTRQQAKKAASRIAKDIAEQQAQGKVTVTGFPEVSVFDAIVMPQSQTEDRPNYNPNQPMGGTAYSVYKVVHKLNESDGFKTDIHVAGLVGSSRIVLSEYEEKTLTGEFKDSDGDGIPDAIDSFNNNTEGGRGYGL